MYSDIILNFLGIEKTQKVLGSTLVQIWQYRSTQYLYYRFLFIENNGDGYLVTIIVDTNTEKVSILDQIDLGEKELERYVKDDFVSLPDFTAFSDLGIAGVGGNVGANMGNSESMGENKGGINEISTEQINQQQ